MGYFANGTQGKIYRARYCHNCVHDKDDEFLLHLNHNGGKNYQDILNDFIPIAPNGIDNGQYRMLHARGVHDE